jgi:hypothetical protein
MKTMIVLFSLLLTGCTVESGGNRADFRPLILENYAYMESKLENCAFIIRKSLIKGINLDMGEVEWVGIKSGAIDSMQFTFTGKYHVSLVDGITLTLPDDKVLFKDGFYHGCFLLEK